MAGQELFIKSNANFMFLRMTTYELLDFYVITPT